ncbi:hypothetical protein QBC34DRAFT_388873 [Podospora aff. communis PSN243]|uniref:Uncharacterized protein n=1 Tax=Podospora aff. communis PSN243 TaxID=3040156 RepID=A0AAV9H8H0_9PEZI|nr:hypothetical protein QBC34DRAFT_388873 [Podospora aff. communis PSN243]
MEKGPVSHSDFEVDSRDMHLQSKARSLRMVDNARVGVTALALLMSITILGVSGNTLAVYDHTRLPGDFNSLFSLALWPADFNIRPTVALVVGSSIIMVTNIAALCFSKVPSVSLPLYSLQPFRLITPQLRSKTTTHTSTTFVAPLIGLTAALVSIIFFYAVNASDEVDTFLSWTCRWQDVPMTQQPNWGTLCHQSRTALYMAILLIPVEAAALGLAGFQLKTEKYADQYSNAARKGSQSPALSGGQ